MKEIIRISKGPQFQGGKAALPFFGFLFLVAFGVYSIFTMDFWIAAIVFVVAIGLLIYILDIQGIEVDKRNQRIRDYKIGLLGKTGEWKEYKGFKTVLIDYESYEVRVTQIYTGLTTMSREGLHGKEEHGRFVIVLAHQNIRQSFMLGERENISEAIRFAKHCATRLKLPVYEKFRERPSPGKA